MSELRPVRITIEGVATPSHDERHLEVRNPEGWDWLARVVSAAPGVTVEWLPEPYDWRDGDVVQCTLVNAGHVAGRRFGQWLTNTNGHTFTDDEMSRLVNGGTYRVLRYQAGEEEQ